MAKKKIVSAEKHIGHYSVQECIEMSQEDFDKLTPQEIKDDDHYLAYQNSIARAINVVLKNSALEKLAKKTLKLIDLAEESGLTPEVILASTLANGFDGDIQN